MTAPNCLGWFIKRRIQQYLMSCASCGHIDAVNVTLLNFQAKQQQLEDGLYLHPLCLYLKTKCGMADAELGSRARGGFAFRAWSAFGRMQ